jgi:hypothetical protein
VSNVRTTSQQDFECEEVGVYSDAILSCSQLRSTSIFSRKSAKFVPVVVVFPAYNKTALITY